MSRLAVQTPLIGAALVAGYTAAITGADALTKHLAVTFEAPQILVLCAGAILLISLGSAWIGGEKVQLRTSCPGAMLLRSVSTVFAAVLFYYSFALLPFADVFLFIAMVPILAGLMSAPILGEKVSTPTWIALALGAIGVYLLFPGGVSDIGWGHMAAFGAALTGTFAIVMSRFIARRESNALAQVFFPQLAVFISMGLIAPFFWVPMSGADMLFAIACGGILFVARYALALAMQSLPAYAATPLINLQFVWMVIVGIVIFHEIPAINTLLGALVIVGSGLFLVLEQHMRPFRLGLTQLRPVRA